MSLTKKVYLTISGYDIKLSDNLMFYQNDQLKLIFYINEYGIDYENNATTRALMPVNPLNAILFIENPEGVDSVSSAKIEDNAVTFYLDSTHTQYVGVSRMQLRLFDQDGCAITLPHFTFEIRENIYGSGDVRFQNVVMVDHTGTVILTEDNDMLDVGDILTMGTEVAYPQVAKTIKDLPIKHGLDGTEKLIVEDNEATKQASLGTIVDEIKQNSQEKIREIESELAQTNAQLSQTNTLLGDDGTLQANNRDLFHSTKDVWLNVKDYGAKGDGITDDTEAIKLALSKGNNLYFPVGVYVISEKIDLNKSTCMKGSTCMKTWGSPAKTILKGIHNDFIFECFWNNANNFERLTFQGKGIKMPCCSHIIECEFTGVLGIELLRVSVVERCSFHNCSEAGIKTATDSRISSNFFYNNEIGIYMYNSNDNIISNNKIEWNGVGIQLDTNTYNLIQGNIFDRNTTFGIDAKNGSQLSIKNNQFERNLIHHIRISSKIFNIIGNSFFHKNTEDDMSGEMLPIEAIQLKSTQQGLITANTVQGKKMFSTSHDFFSDNTIQGNLINGVSDSPKWVNIGSVTVPNAQTKTLRYEWSNLDYLKANGYDVLIRSFRVTNGDNIYYNATVTQHKNNGIYVDVTNNTGSDKTFDVFVLLEHLQWTKR